MTLDEAIRHCEKVAKENKQIAFDLATTFNRETINSKKCKRCAEDHLQLAGWLKDYKRLLKESEGREETHNEDIVAKSIATAFQFGLAMGFVKKYDEMDKVMEEVKKAIKSEPKIGYWILKEVRKEKSLVCSECRSDLGSICPTEYCSECGCRMLGVIEEEKYTAESEEENG